MFLAANWKMHSPPQGWDGEDSPYRTRVDKDVVVFPSTLDIRTCIEKFLIVGAQYGRPEPRGAFTGDVSMQLLAEHGCRYVLCGHSERRNFHSETDAFIAQQVKAAMDAGIEPILCIGETDTEREKGQQKEVVARQLQNMPCPTLIAYEPVWAIGTGKNATPEQAQEMHAFIRSLLPSDAQATTRILYGGSVKPENAADLLRQSDIDGLLVGSASLDPKLFRSIVDITASSL
jgi:triosephosphate isomerase